MSLKDDGIGVTRAVVVYLLTSFIYIMTNPRKNLTSMMVSRFSNEIETMKEEVVG